MRKVGYEVFEYYRNLHNAKKNFKHNEMAYSPYNCRFQKKEELLFGFAATVEL